MAIWRVVLAELLRCNRGLIAAPSLFKLLRPALDGIPPRVPLRFSLKNRGLGPLLHGDYAAILNLKYHAAIGRVAIASMVQVPLPSTTGTLSSLATASQPLP